MGCALDGEALAGGLLSGAEVGVPRGAEVFPSWIAGLDEGDFFGAGPAFEFLLPVDGIADLNKAFEPDEARAVVARSEAGMFLLLVLEGAGAHVSGDTDVEGFAFAGHDVDEVGAAGHGARVADGEEEWGAVGHS